MFFELVYGTNEIRACGEQVFLEKSAHRKLRYTWPYSQISYYYRYKRTAYLFVATKLTKSLNA